MKTLLIPFCLTWTLLSSGCAFAQPDKWSNPWEATILVKDESGIPLQGVDVTVGYTVDPHPGQSQEEGRPGEEIVGKTDGDGMFRASHTDSSWGLGIVVQKSGYYTTHIGHELSIPGQVDDAAVYKSRHPIFKITLKKVGHPIPMYARRVESALPILNKPVGYDLVAGDWLAPYGKGQIADVIFTGDLNQRMQNHLDYRLTINFSNAGDGIQEFRGEPSRLPGTVSDLRSPREAPNGGYKTEWVQTEKRRPRVRMETNRDGNRNYFFRVRTVLDEKGNVRSAQYGKIYGDFMQFTYYLNPTPNDRNVEFDPAHNLIPDQRISAP